MLCSTEITDAGIKWSACHPNTQELAGHATPTADSCRSHWHVQFASDKASIRVCTCAQLWREKVPKALCKPDYTRPSVDMPRVRIPNAIWFETLLILQRLTDTTVCICTPRFTPSTNRLVAIAQLSNFCSASVKLMKTVLEIFKKIQCQHIFS